MKGKKRKVRKGEKEKLEIKENLDERIMKKYSKLGVNLLSDQTPKKLEKPVQIELEGMLGIPIKDVRIHTGEKAQIATQTLKAKAFAVGDKDIFFAKGEFQPSTTGGKALLAHELQHLSDVSTTFAKSLRIPESRKSELQAMSAEERVFAMEEGLKKEEEIEMVEPQPVDVEELTGGEEEGKEKIKVIDKKELEEMVWELLEKQMKKDKERTGK